MSLSRVMYKVFIRRLTTCKETQIPKRDGTIGKIQPERAFMEYDRQTEGYRPPLERINDWNEIANDFYKLPLNEQKIQEEQRQIQAARCMDCGTPFCQSYTGCPLNNLIPEWNDLVYQNQWKAAIDRLHSTNNFPEFTGRVCPAPCEGACVAGLVDQPVTIKNIEYSIIDYAFQHNWILPRIPQNRTGLNVAIIGSGPSGLACADILNQFGHTVNVYEREDSIGGLLMYGIPNMKLSKDTVNRRINLLELEGINFNVNCDIRNISDIPQHYDALVLCIGSTIPRDLPHDIPGRDLNGIYYAMEFLTNNQKYLQSKYSPDLHISAKDKHVIVIGGGDTGNDCIGTSVRHSAKSITNLELLSKPPSSRNNDVNPWPQYPRVFSIDYGHEEVKYWKGYDPRNYNILTKEFLSDNNGNVSGLKTVKSDKNGNIIPNTEKVYPADLVLLSMGFTNPETDIINSLNINIKYKNNNNDSFVINSNNKDYKTNINGVFSAGDCRRGQSLVVWAIAEGRGVANAVQKYFEQWNNN